MNTKSGTPVTQITVVTNVARHSFVVLGRRRKIARTAANRNAFAIMLTNALLPRLDHLHGPIAPG